EWFVRATFLGLWKALQLVSAQPGIKFVCKGVNGHAFARRAPFWPMYGKPAITRPPFYGALIAPHIFGDRPPVIERPRPRPKVKVALHPPDTPPPCPLP